MSTPEITSSAVLQCSFGLTPQTLMVLPLNRVTACNLPAATILDNKPLVNVLPFGMCSSPTNPEVISLTAAAMGVPTPAPCVPVITAPWEPGSPTVTIGGIPVVDANCKLLCAWAGVISIQVPAQMTVTVP